MNGFSAHADQRDLVEFVGDARKGGRLRSVLLVHGEPPPQAILADLLRRDGVRDVRAPAAGERVVV